MIYSYIPISIAEYLNTFWDSYILLVEKQNGTIISEKFDGFLKNLTYVYDVMQRAHSSVALQEKWKHIFTQNLCTND